LIKYNYFQIFMNNFISARNIFETVFSRNKLLIIILLISFGLSIFYSFYFQITPLVDARAYDNIAQNIVNGPGYKEDLSLDMEHDYAIARVGPLYEYFLAGIYKIFGHHYGAVWFLQALLHALSAWLLYLTVLLVFSTNEKRKKIALWATAIFGFYPDLIEISAMLMTETLSLFFVCLFLYLFFRFFIDTKNCWLVLLLGLISGLAVLARPPVLFLLPIVYFLFFRKKLFWQAAVFSVALFLIFVPWTARNYKVYDEIMPFGAAGQFNFWIGNQPGGNGEQEPTLQQQHFLETHKATEINPESMRQFKNFVFNYPAEFIKLTLLRINKYFSVIRPMGFWFYQHGLGQALFIFSSALASVFLFIFGLAGAIKAWRAKEVKLNYLLGFLVFTPLIIFATVVETRYRFQVYPLLAIFAGYFIADFSKNSWLKSGALKVSLLLVALNGLADLLMSIERFKERINNFF